MTASAASVPALQSPERAPRLVDPCLGLFGGIARSATVLTRKVRSSDQGLARSSPRRAPHDGLAVGVAQRRSTRPSRNVRSTSISVGSIRLPPRRQRPQRLRQSGRRPFAAPSAPDQAIAAASKVAKPHITRPFEPSLISDSYSRRVPRCGGAYGLSDSRRQTTPLFEPRGSKARRQRLSKQRGRFPLPC